MQTVLKNLDKNYKEMIKFTQSLIKINSVNNNETEVAKILQEKLKEYGINSKLIGRNRERKSLVAKIKGTNNKSIMLNGHLDTVPIGDVNKWKYNPLSAKYVNGKIFGRGSYDMKGGVSAMTYCAISLIESGIQLNGDIILVFNSDEEGGNHTGVREVLNSGIKADACIVGEPMKENKLRLGSRGIYRFKIITEGKTAHTGTIEKKGINAVTKMAKVLLELGNMKQRYKKHKLCPPPKITPGTVINGGSAINIVPDKCEASVDCRLSLGQTKRTILEDIKRTIKILTDKDKEISYRIQESAYSPAYVTNEKEKIIKISVRNIKKILKINPVFVVSGPMTDGNLIYTKGIPVVTFGPKGENSHSENEFVYTKSMLDMAKVYSLVILDFFKCCL